MVPPANQTVLQLENVTFSCSASGIPRPILRWERVSVNGSLLPTENDIIIEEMMGEREVVSSLTIVAVQPCDSGQYTCVAINVVGTTTAVATLTVHGK